MNLCKEQTLLSCLKYKQNCSSVNPAFISEILVDWLRKSFRVTNFQDCILVSTLCSISSVYVFLNILNFWMWETFLYSYLFYLWSTHLIITVLVPALWRRSARYTHNTKSCLGYTHNTKSWVVYTHNTKSCVGYTHYTKLCSIHP